MAEIRLWKFSIEVGENFRDNEKQMWAIPLIGATLGGYDFPAEDDEEAMRYIYIDFCLLGVWLYFKFHP